MIFIEIEKKLVKILKDSVQTKDQNLLRCFLSLEDIIMVVSLPQR